MSRKQIHAAAAALGRLGGLAKSAAKASAVRENGKKGGRPRKRPTFEGMADLRDPETVRRIDEQINAEATFAKQEPNHGGRPRKARKGDRDGIR